MMKLGVNPAGAAGNFRVGNGPDDPLGSNQGGEDGGGGGVVSTMLRELKDLQGKMKGEDEEGFISPFAGIEKTAVLQEAHAAFNNPQVVKSEPKKCCALITKLLFLLAQGENFQGSEATGIFFAVTKLFQSQNMNLRRMTYLFLKEVAESTDSAEIIIVVASLTRDMNSQVDSYRANSIRVLCKIIDAGMLGQIDRYVRQAIVDKDPQVSSCALVCGNQMVTDNAKREIVRRWLNEIQESVQSRSEMAQYHALSLLYHIKAHDKLAVSKLVTQLAKKPPKSPLATCLLVRYTSRLLFENMNATDAREAYKFLETCLRHKNEMVIYEAARAICRLPEVAARDILPAITVLQLFLSSPKPTLRFSAVRTLNEVAIKHPQAVAKCNDDMEALIQDSNRSIATLAITTLLKTGSESSVDRLMKQISSFMSEIADEFKIVVVRAIRSLCLKYPKKHRVMLNFLSGVLREEGGFDFKKTIVDTILELIEVIPGTKEPGLFHLCELIEDCEFTSLSVDILHVLGKLGPTANNPAKYIRFIYNRVILENAHIRAAAVSSLGMFAAKVDYLTPSILILLKRCLKDDDDEVRDRATITIKLLESRSPIARSLLVDGLPMTVDQLSRSLDMYKQRPAPGPISFEALPVVEPATLSNGNGGSGNAENDEDDDVTGGKVDSDIGMTSSSAGNNADPESSGLLSTAEELYRIPEFAQLGPLAKSCAPVALTEQETEYLVRVVKHIFQNHVVLQFNLTNTIPENLLTDVEVQVEESGVKQWSIESQIPCSRLPYDVTKPAYVCLKRLDKSSPLESSVFSCELRFKVKEVTPGSNVADDDDEGYEDSYPVEPVEISASDFMSKMNVADFRAAWQEMGDSNEQTEAFELSQYSTVEQAAAGVIDFLAMRPCDGTAAVPPQVMKHSVLLAGQYLGGVKVLAHAVLSQLAKPDGSPGMVTLKIAVRSDDPQVTSTVLDCIR